MRLLDEHDLTEKNIRPFSREQRYRLIRAGKFPKPIKIGTRNFWPESEIDEWQTARVKAAIAERDRQFAGDDYSLSPENVEAFAVGLK